MKDPADYKHHAVLSDSEQLPDAELLELVQRRTFGFFWECAHPKAAMARDRVSSVGADKETDLIATGGSGFGVMAIIVAVERGWIAREAAVERLRAMAEFLSTAESHHGIFPHYLNGATGKAVSMWMGDAGADIVETAFLFQGLLCARQYFSGTNAAETALRGALNDLWTRAEWNWHAPEGRDALVWHWGPEFEWGTDHQIRGWDECLIAYVLGASSPDHAISAAVYHEGWAVNRSFQNGQSYYGITLPLGQPFGGPLFFSQFSFMGLDPRGLKDRYADYWEQNRAHALINYEHCVQNPNSFSGYGADCWGLTASDGDHGYCAHAPDCDRGVIAPTAAISSIPYTPEQSMRALRRFIGMGDRVWRRYGFIDAFNETAGWYADDYLAIDQGPIVVMIENYRTGLLWRLFMSCEEVQGGLQRLGFESWRGV